MKKWLKIIISAGFFVMLSMGMITPIYAIFVEKIGGDILIRENLPQNGEYGKE